MDAQALQEMLRAQRPDPGTKELFAAYVAAWGDLGTGVAKDANNPHFGNDYATLESCLKTIKPVFAKHGLAILQLPAGLSADGVQVTTLLCHSSGQHIAMTASMPLGGKLTAQAVGSAITYCRRYALQALAGVAPTDDDGEAASQPAPAPKKSTPKASKEADQAGSAVTNERSYAAKVEDLIEEIEKFAGNAEQLEVMIRPRVEDLGDEKVNSAYVAKRRALKGKK